MERGLQGRENKVIVGYYSYLNRYHLNICMIHKQKKKYRKHPLCQNYTFPVVENGISKRRINILDSRHQTPQKINVIASTPAIWMLRPINAIWRYRSRSALVHIIACCLTTPSHRLNNGGIFCVIQLRSISQQALKLSAAKMSLNITLLKLPPHFLGQKS